MAQLRRLPEVSHRELELFHDLRKSGNDAIHEHGGSASAALRQLRNAYELGVWFHRRFGQDPAFVEPGFVQPTRRDSRQQEDRLRRLEEDLEEQRSEQQRLEDALRQREAQVQALEEKQRQIELERQRLTGQRDQLMVEKQRSQETAQGEIEARVVATLKELEDNRSQLEQNQQQLERFRQQFMRADHESRQQQDRLRQLEQELEDQKRQRQQLAEELRKRESQVAELTGRQGEIESERRRLIRERDLLIAEQEKLHSDKVQFADIEMKLEAKARELEANQSRLEENRKQLIAFQQRELEARAAEVRAWKRIIAIVLLGLLGVVAIALLIKGCGPPPPTSTTPSRKETGNTPPPVISPSDAAKYEGQLCTVRFTIQSNYDGFDWGFLMNSMPDSRDPQNFEVVIDKATAGKKYKEMGVGNLTEYFKKGTAVEVTGKIEKYKDKRTNRDRYELRVKDPEKVKRQ